MEYCVSLHQAPFLWNSAITPTTQPKKTSTLRSPCKHLQTMLTPSMSECPHGMELLLVSIMQSLWLTHFSVTAHSYVYSLPQFIATVSIKSRIAISQCLVPRNCHILSPFRPFRLHKAFLIHYFPSSKEWDMVPCVHQGWYTNWGNWDILHWFDNSVSICAQKCYLGSKFTYRCRS